MLFRISALAQIFFVCSLAACSGSNDSSSGGADSGAQTDGALDTTTTNETGADAATDAPIDAATDAHADVATETETSGEAGAGAVGTACTDGSQCSTDFCITDTRFPGGYCSQTIVECPAPGGGPNPCPTGSSCLNVAITGGTGSGDACMRDCAADGDCRVAEGYKCCPISTDTHVCLPISLCLP